AFSDQLDRVREALEREAFSRNLSQQHQSNQDESECGAEAKDNPGTILLCPQITRQGYSMKGKCLLRKYSIWSMTVFCFGIVHKESANSRALTLPSFGTWKAC